VVLYGGRFISEHRDVAQRFIRAYLRAVRDYNDALSGGRLAGPKGEDVIAILTEYTHIKDAAVYRAITPQGCNPDGHVHLPSLRNDLAFFRAQGDVKADVSVEQVVDMSFVDAAVKDLGPYRRAAR